MNLYLVEKDAQKNRIEIFEAVRRSLQDLYPGSVPETNITLVSDGESTFFLRSADRRLWGRVFYEPLSYAGLESLAFEIESLPKPLQAFLFFPSITKGVSECLAEIPGRPYFFEYCFLRPSKAGQRDDEGFALRQWFPSLPPKKTEGIPAREAYHFYRHARLSREELSQLMEIGLHLKKLPAA